MKLMLPKHLAASFGKNYSLRKLFRQYVNSREAREAAEKRKHQLCLVKIYRIPKDLKNGQPEWLDEKVMPYKEAIKWAKKQKSIDPENIGWRIFIDVDKEKGNVFDKSDPVK